MSASQLGRRLGVSGPAVTALERSERNGTAKLNSLRKAAAAMDCALVYAFIPNSSLTETVRSQAERIVDIEADAVAHTMALEEQGAGISDEARAEAIEKLVASGRLWQQ